MNNNSLEQYYEATILPLFQDNSLIKITWKDHGRVGLDTYAHHFENTDGVEYILVNEDFPGSEYPPDKLTHKMVAAPSTDDGIIRIDTEEAWTPNVSGYFSLYKESINTKDLNTRGF